MTKPREEIPIPIASISIESQELIEKIMELEFRGDKTAIEALTTLAESFISN